MIWCKVQFGINLHEWVLQWVQFQLFEKPTSSNNYFIPKSTRKTLWLLINVNTKKFTRTVGSARRSYLFLTLAQKFSSNLFNSAGSCSLISKLMLFPSHHGFHTLNQNDILLMVLIFFAPFLSSFIVSSVARVNLSWFNAAIFCHARKFLSKSFFKIFIIILYDIGLENFLLSFNQ